MQVPQDYLVFLPSNLQAKPAPLDEFRDGTIAQINRDLGFFGEAWNAPDSMKTADLIPDLAEALAKIQRDSGKLPQLMYRMDVSEARLSEILGSFPGEEGWLHVAALVWQRELKKVWLRKHYSSSEGDRE